MAERFGPPDPIGERPIRSKMPGHKGPTRFALRIGEIQRVDYETMLCDIYWLQGKTPPAREVPLTAAYWSKRGFLGSMPEAGSIVICGFSAAHEDKGVQPYILTFLPNGFKTALGFDPFGFAERDSDEISAPLETLQRELEGIYGPVRHKMRKLYPGDIYGASDSGAEFILDRDARFLNSGGSEIWLRSDDMSLITTTLDAYHSTAATRSRTGRVTRSALTIPEDLTFSADMAIFEYLVDAGIIYPDGELLPDVNGLPAITLESGERLALVTENLGDPLDPDVRVYTEDRTEVQEFSDQRLPFPDHYGFDADQIGDEPHWNPFIERVSGTVVGNDPYSVGGRSNYGKLLKPVLFTDPNATSGDPRLEPVPNSSGESEKALVAAHLYRMRRPDGLGELFVAHDKEGHVFLSIPASTSKKSNLGAGRSLEAEFKGSIKMTIGANKNDTSSLDISARGGAKWSLGTLSSDGRSLDLNAAGGLGVKAGSDRDGFSLNAEMSGSVGMAVEGSIGIATTGDSIEEVNGQKRVSAEGLEQSVGTGDMNTTVMSAQNNTIRGDVTTNIGEGRSTTIVGGSEELVILKGDRKTTFGAPATDSIKFLSSGTHKVSATGPLTCSWESTTSGNFSFQASAGSYSVTMGLGSIAMSGASVDVDAATSINIRAPRIAITGKVTLGTATAVNAAVGGVPGPSPYIDPFTGNPVTGNPLVTVP